jgi:hypothetical protein
MELSGIDGANGGGKPYAEGAGALIHFSNEKD